MSESHADPYESVTATVRDVRDLFPTIQTLQELIQSDDAQPTKVRRLGQAILNLAYSGDIDVLTWLLSGASDRSDSSSSRRSSTSTSHSLKDGLVSQIEIGTLRSQDASAAGPVTHATCAGHVDLVRLLVDHGAEVDERDAEGWTPLMWAINAYNLALVSYLLQHGANVEAQSHCGTSCEDFVIMTCQTASPHSHVNGSSDHELITDLVYDYLSIAAAKRAQSEALHSPAASSLSLSSTSASSVSQDGVQHPPSANTSSSTPTASRAWRHSDYPNHLGLLDSPRRPMDRKERNQNHEADLRAREADARRRKALLDIATFLDAPYNDLVGLDQSSDEEMLPPSWTVRKEECRERARGRKKTPKFSSLDPGCGAIEVAKDPFAVEFSFDTIQYHQMLVLGEYDIDPVLDQLIGQAKPTRAPWRARAEPANVLFMYLRWSHMANDEDLTANIIYAALETIEDNVKRHESSITHLAFWLFNLTLLLHYTKRDTVLNETAKMWSEFRPFINDLIKEIHFSIIRDVERRISRLLEPAMLEHDSIGGLDEIRFEGDWNIMKSLTGSVKSGFGSAGSNAPNTPPRKPLSQIFGRRGSEDVHSLPGSPQLSPVKKAANRSRLSVANFTSPLKKTASPSPVVETIRHEVDATELLAHPTPRTLTSLLNSALQVLQLYEINPAVIIQAFSQIFYWIGAELFNKVLTNKKYLCRSKATQLKLNVSALEDWARSNALPPALTRTHFAPLNELISWLTCQSSLHDFDALIATLQGLKGLNPRQLRRAVRDYRYELSEGRMSDECLQYLAQWQSDWERDVERSAEMEEEKKARKELDEIRAQLMKMQIAGEPVAQSDAAEGGKDSAASHVRSGTATAEDPYPDELDSSDSSEAQAADETLVRATNGSTDHDLDSPAAYANAAEAAIDSLFLPGRSMSDFQPLNPQESSQGGSSAGTQELMASSRMLPFSLPSRVEALVVSPGDSLGFGRGHFSGTGAPPSVRSVAAQSTNSSSRGSGHAHAHGHGHGHGHERNPSSLSETFSMDKIDSLLSEDHATAAQPSSSASTTSATTTSTSRSVFTTGRGFASGGFWQPVPLLREETLDTLREIMRHTARQWDVMAEKRGRSKRHSGGLAPAHLGGQLPSRMVSLEKTKAIAAIQADGHRDADVDGKASPTIRLSHRSSSLSSSALMDPRNVEEEMQKP